MVVVVAVGTVVAAANATNRFESRINREPGVDLPARFISILAADASPSCRGTGNITAMPATESTSASLLDRLKRREDTAAWERFVALYTPLLYHWLRGAGLTEEDAADLVQDIFAKLLVQMPTFDYQRSQSFHGWLRTMALNCRRDLQKRKTPANLGDAETQAFVPDPLEAFIEREYRQQLAIRAMHILRSDFQLQTWQAVWDLIVEGKAANEVASKAGMTVQAVYAAKCRVLARLRQELQGLWC